MILSAIWKCQNLVLGLIFICVCCSTSNGQAHFSTLPSTVFYKKTNSFSFSKSQFGFKPKNYPALAEAFSFSSQGNELSCPKSYSYSDLAFFCKMEVQLEKAVKMPVKFRLGDVRYVDYLEQKTEYFK